MTNSLTFIGTATTLVRLGQFTLLTDPNFLHRGQRAYLGKGLWSRRLTDPAMQVDDVPVLDAVILSHLHGDHFDRVARRGLTRSAPLITTRPAAERLRRYGFHTRGLAVWDRHVLEAGDERLIVEAVPAIHARGAMGLLLPSVIGTYLEHEVGGVVDRRLLISGDTLTGDHVDAIHERHPDLDAVILHLGGTRILWQTVTMDALQGVDYVQRTQPRAVVPVHYDDYRVFRSPLAAFLRQASAHGLDDVIRVVPRGATTPI